MILEDSAAVETAAGDPEAACGYAKRALESLAVSGSATGIERTSGASFAVVWRGFRYASCSIVSKMSASVSRCHPGMSSQSAT